MTTLYDLRAREIVQQFRTEGLSFWLISLYLFFEYVRPQTLYPSIDILPFGKIIVILTICVALSKHELFNTANVANKWLVAYLLVVVASSLTAMSPEQSFQKLPEFIAWVLIYFAIINIVNTEERFLIFMLCFLLYNFKMSQFSFFGWARTGFGFSKDGTGGGPGWFQNSGEFGIEMCIFLALSIYFIVALKTHWPRWKTLLLTAFPVGAFLGTISSSSRGAVLGAFSVVFWMLLKSRSRFKGWLGVLVVVAALLYLVPVRQIERFKEAGADNTSVERLVRWQKGLEMAGREPILGVGFENWAEADRTLFGGSGRFCHNIFIQCVSELGYTGLVVFMILIFFTLQNNYQTRMLATGEDERNDFLYFMAHGLDGALIGYLVSGFFVTVLYYPYFWINLAMTVSLNQVAKRYADEADTELDAVEAA